MEARELIRQLIDESPSLSQNRLGTVIGISPQNMSNRMRATSMKVGFLTDCLDALGYDLVAVPKAMRLPNGARRITDTERR